MKHKITQEIEALATNKEKLEKWFSYGLHPKYGLSQELTRLMYDLYAAASGDSQYNGRFNCGACQDTIWRKLQDFMKYGDNLGKPLLNWEAPEPLNGESDSDIPEDEIKPVKTKKKRTKKDATGTDTTPIVE